MYEEYEYIQLNSISHSRVFKFFSRDDTRKIPVHFHEEIEILFCVNGQLKIWIEGTEKVIYGGELFFINSAVPHATQSMTNSEVIVLYLKESVFLEEEVIVSFQQGNKNELSKVLRLIFAIYEQDDKEERFKNYQIKALVSSLEVELLMHFSQDVNKYTQRQISQNKRFGKILMLVRSHFSENISLAELSQLSGYSMHYLSRLFRKNTGSTFNDYKKSLGLDLVLKMLETTNESFEEIASRAGFPNEKSMREYFKKNMGISPRVYKMSKNDRKQLKN